MQASRRIFSLLLCFIFPAFLLAQTSSSSFKSIYTKANQAFIFKPGDTLKCQKPTERLAQQLINREYWPVNELDSIDCMLNKLEGTENKHLLAVYYYSAAGAYNDYDQEVSDSLLKRAYFLFRDLDDVEGQLFTTVELLDNSLSTLKNTSDSTIVAFFNDISALSKRTTFRPALLAALDTDLLLKQKNNQLLPEATLDSLLSYADQFTDIDPLRIRSIYTRIFILYQLGGFYNSAAIAARKALVLANPDRADYPSFFYNLAFNKYMVSEMDSALYYFTKAYKLCSAPKTLYQYNLKYISAQGMSGSYKKLGEIDSAFKYSVKALYGAVEFANYEASEKRIYAEKKFELQKQRANVLEKELQISVQQKEYLKLLVIVSGISLLFIVALFLAYKNAKLLKQTKALQLERERLIHIIAHDLRGPLHTFLQSASVISKLVELKRHADIVKVGKSLEYTGITLKDAIANLESWSESLKTAKSKKSPHAQESCDPIAIALTVKELYSLRAEQADKKVTIQSQISFTVPFSANDLALIIRNMVANGIAHADSGTTVDIFINRDSKESFSIKVSNATSQENAERAMEIIDASNKKGTFQATNSSRLGLELIYSTVKRLGGQITASHKGGIFTIEVVLPVKAPNVSA